MRYLQPVDECECRDILTVVGNLGQLPLEVADVGLEVIALPHFDSEKVVVISLGLLAKGVLGEINFGYLLEVVERMVQQRVEPI